jgi:hypothetical protein
VGSLGEKMFSFRSFRVFDVSTLFIGAFIALNSILQFGNNLVFVLQLVSHEILIFGPLISTQYSIVSIQLMFPHCEDYLQGSHSLFLRMKRAGNSVLMLMPTG